MEIVIFMFTIDILVTKEGIHCEKEDSEPLSDLSHCTRKIDIMIYLMKPSLSVSNFGFKNKSFF